LIVVVVCALIGMGLALGSQEARERDAPCGGRDLAFVVEAEVEFARRVGPLGRACGRGRAGGSPGGWIRL
jgi:hypothetical protein